MIEPIPVPFIGDAFARARLDRLLRPFFALVSRGPETFANGRLGDPLVVVYVGAGPEAEWVGLLHAVRKLPHLHVATFVPDRAIRARLVAGGRRERVESVLLEEDRDTALSAFHAAWFQAEASRMARATYAAPGLPTTLRAALRALVNSRLSIAAPPPRTVAQIARSVGVSRGYLSRSATAHSISLPELSHAWLSLLAMDARFATHTAWDRVAWQCGYESPSALTALFRRHHGFVPSLCDRGDFQQAMVGFRERFLTLLEHDDHTR